MRLAEFIHRNRDRIQDAWEARAFDLPAEKQGSALLFQVHLNELLDAIAKDVAKGSSHTSGSESHTAELARAVLRDLAGGSLRQVGEELRILRTIVSELWCQAETHPSAFSLQDLSAFHNVIDQAMGEYIAHYSDELARARDGFLSILGHDLRSPLSAITIAGDYLAMPGMLEGKPLQAAIGIKNSAASMSAMIRNLMAYAKARLGKKTDLMPERSDIGNICEAVVMKARTGFPDYTFLAQIKSKIYGEVDPLRLQQMLDNLVEGAVQQGANGKPITLTAFEDAQAITVQVETAGEGSALDALQLIVDPAVQIPFDAAEPDGKLAGIVGLGLFTAREIVLAHGGAITIERAEQGGTLFTVRLPHPRAKLEKDASERRWRFA